MLFISEISIVSICRYQVRVRLKVKLIRSIWLHNYNGIKVQVKSQISQNFEVHVQVQVFGKEVVIVT